MCRHGLNASGATIRAREKAAYYNIMKQTSTKLK